jgi:hypothetical protein
LELTSTEKAKRPCAANIIKGRQSPGGFFVAASCVAFNHALRCGWLAKTDRFLSEAPLHKKLDQEFHLHALRCYR